MLRDEKGVSMLELIVGIAAVILIVAFTIFLSLGENGISFFKGNETKNLENEIVNDIQQNVDNTVNNDTDENVNS